MRLPRPHATVAALALAVGLAACASDDPATDPATPPAATAPSPGTDTPGEDAAATGSVVQLRNINFEPADVTVSVGDTVTFVNEDLVRHTVTSGDPGDPDGRFDHSLDEQGAEVAVTFDEPGSFAYYCDLHRNMTGTITVEG